MPLAVDFDDVSFAYEGGRPVLEHVDLDVESGEFVAIAGPNGGGKTTLMRLALGLERPTAGRALLFGEPATRFSGRSRLGYLAQRSHLGIDAPATVREVLRVGCRPVACSAGCTSRPGDRVRDDRPRRTRRQRGRAAADALGRPAAAGVHREGAAARPSLLVLDEPTTGVDVEAQEALAELLSRLHRELAVTILYVSHEFGAVERFVERLVLVRGGIVFDGRPDRLPGVWHDPSHSHA